MYLRTEWLGHGYGEVYAFRCPEHGVVESHEHGWMRELRCPMCFAERMEGKSAEQ